MQWLVSLRRRCCERASARLSKCKYRQVRRWLLGSWSAPTTIRASIYVSSEFEKVLRVSGRAESHCGEGPRLKRT
eukprot:s1665_g17.t1